MSGFSYSAFSNHSAIGDEVLRAERERFDRIRGSFAAVLQDRKFCRDFPLGLKVRYLDLNQELSWAVCDHALTMARADRSGNSIYNCWVRALPAAIARREQGRWSG